ncbi:MAG: hypothetical protein MZW92_53050 [Comamonadaceae bacterium]|nr:hypothetical protein [Comamonadaceae bacterium]
MLRREDASDTGEPVSSGGVSRWGGGEPGLRIESVRVCDVEGRTVGVAHTGQPLDFEIVVRAQEDGRFPCIFCVLVFTQLGQWLTRDAERALREPTSAPARPRAFGSTRMRCSSATGRTSSRRRSTRTDLRDLARARFYDLLSRSFELRVLSDLPDDESVFVHPRRWERIEPKAAEDVEAPASQAPARRS